MKKYSIAQNNLNYIKEILDRDNISYNIEGNGENFVLFSDISKSSFKDILEEALCKRKKDELNSIVPFYGHRILNDTKLFHSLQQANKIKSFCITSEELFKYLGYEA